MRSFDLQGTPALRSSGLARRARTRATRRSRRSDSMGWCKCAWTSPIIKQ